LHSNGRLSESETKKMLDEIKTAVKVPVVAASGAFSAYAVMGSSSIGTEQSSQQFGLVTYAAIIAMQLAGLAAMLVLPLGKRYQKPSFLIALFILAQALCAYAAIEGVKTFYPPESGAAAYKLDAKIMPVFLLLVLGVKELFGIGFDKLCFSKYETRSLSKHMPYDSLRSFVTSGIEVGLIIAGGYIVEKIVPSTHFDTAGQAFGAAIAAVGVTGLGIDLLTTKIKNSVSSTAATRSDGYTALAGAGEAIPASTAIAFGSINGPSSEAHRSARGSLVDAPPTMHTDIELGSAP